MATEPTATAAIVERAGHELKELAIISTYLYVTLGSVILLRTAALHTMGVDWAPWGIALIKAVVLGKFVLLGNMLHIAGRDISGPLVWPVLRRAFVFLVMLIVLTILEEVVAGWFHHRSIADSLGELFGPQRLPETLASYLIMLLVLIPFFAFRVLSRRLGRGRLERLFFGDGQFAPST